MYLGESMTFTGSDEKEVMVTLGVTCGGLGDSSGGLALCAFSGTGAGSSGGGDRTSATGSLVTSAMLTSGMILGTTEETITGRIWEVEAETQKRNSLYFLMF